MAKKMGAKNDNDKFSVKAGWDNLTEKEARKLASDLTRKIDKPKESTARMIIINQTQLNKRLNANNKLKGNK